MYLFPFFSPSRFVLNHRTHNTASNYKVSEYKDKFNIDIAMPGRETSDIDVQLNGQKLMVEIPKSSLLVDEDHIEQTLWQELDLGAKSYAFTLDHQIDLENIEAKAVQGILSISIMKKQPENLKIPIDIK